MDANESLLAILNRSVKVDVGRLPCPTGSIVACDPFFCASASPLRPQVPPGEYEIVLHRIRLPGFGWRIGAAQLVLQKAQLVGIEAAVQDDDRPSRHFVDSGLSSFMDDRVRIRFVAVLESFARTSPNKNYYSDVLDREFRASASDPSNPFDAGTHCLHHFGEEAQETVALFSSGLGDGAYGSYWGLDQQGKRVSLLTSFGLFCAADSAHP